MRVIIMGCGRVGSELSHELLDDGHEVTVIDKNAEAFFRYPPGEGAKTVVGLGFDRDMLEEAGIKDADAFVAVSSGDNSNIVSARVALENYHVPKVVARIYDPRRADIYERLNIPTVATTTLGREADPADAVPRPAGDPRDARRRRAAAHAHAGRPRTWWASPRPSFNVAGQDPGRRRLARRRRLPARPTTSTLQEGDYLVVMLTKDGMDTLDEVFEPPGEHH